MATLLAGALALVDATAAVPPSPLIVSLAPRAMMTSGPHNATRGTGRPAPDAPAAAVRLLRCRSIDSGLP